MKIELDFNIGDPLYWISDIQGNEGPVLLEIRKAENSIDGIKVMRDTKGNLQTLILTDSGSEDLPGSQYACLTYEQAMEWCKNTYPGAVLLPGSGTVKGIFIDCDGNREVIDVPLSVSWMEQYICGGIESGHPDDNGYFTISGKSARRDGEPITMFVVDGAGIPIDVMYGEFLLLRMEKTGNMSRLVDVDPTMLELRKEKKESKKKDFNIFSFGETIQIPQDILDNLKICAGEPCEVSINQETGEIVLKPCILKEGNDQYALFEIGNSSIVFIRTCDGGWAYSIYGKASTHELNEGFLKDPNRSIIDAAAQICITQGFKPDSENIKPLPSGMIQNFA